MNDVKTKYGVARGLASFVSFLGGVMIIIGCLWLFGLYSLEVAFQFFVVLGSGLGFVVFGFVFMVVGQITKAVVDTADNSREMLKLMQQQSEN